VGVEEYKSNQKSSESGFEDGAHQVVMLQKWLP